MKPQKFKMEEIRRVTEAFLKYMKTIKSTNPKTEGEIVKDMEQIRITDGLFKNKFTGVKLRQLVNVMRREDKCPIIAGPDGYYTETKESSSLREWAKRERERMYNQLMAVEGMERMADRIDAIAEKKGDIFGIGVDWSK